MSENQAALVNTLLEFGKTIPAEEYFPTLVPEATGLVTNNPYAFAISVCLDRGGKAELFWTIPYYLQMELGHLDPNIIYGMSIEALTQVFNKLPKRPRFVNDAPKTLQQLTKIVVEECGGRAELIWQLKRAVDVKRIFRSIHGVGPGIANMSVLLIEKAFGYQFATLDRKEMDIKPDVHTVRVLYRLGVTADKTEYTAIESTRLLNPEFPGELDLPLWEIGRNWCFSSNPDCSNCVVEAYCVKNI